MSKPRQVRIVMGQDELLCVVETSANKTSTFVGVLSEPLRDPSVRCFWEDYESAVNGIMLAEIDMLEKQLMTLNFSIEFEGTEYAAFDVDLQIFPSSGEFSFSMPMTVSKKS